jgi:hypothetical protein
VKELELHKMSEGGYVVIPSGMMRSYEGYRVPAAMFASTTIDEALKFIKNKMEPKVK